MLCHMLTNIVYKKLGSKYLRLGRPRGLCLNYPLRVVAKKQPQTTGEVNGCGHFPLKLYLQKQVQTLCLL